MKAVMIGLALFLVMGCGRSDAKKLSEELDEERIKEHGLDPDEFNEPMYELILYVWRYCDSSESVELGDVLDYYGIEKRFLHPLSIFWFN